MTQRSRQISILALLFCFLAPIGFTYVVLKMRQHKVKEQVKREIIKGIDKGELLELTFSLKTSESLDWEHEREFEYLGQSYDVVEKKIEGDSITYSVWWDKVETKIKNQLTLLVSKAMSNDKPQKENQQRLDHFFKSLYSSTDYWQSENLIIRAKLKSSEVFSKYMSLMMAPPVPPPNA